MSRRRKNPGAKVSATPRVCGFRLDERCDQKLREKADRFATTPNQYARAVLTTHLLGDATEPTATPAAEGLDELGTFLHQVRDELLLEAERQGKRLDAFTGRVNALAERVKDLIERVQEVDQRLADFLTRVEPM
jgi:hypothetical protein